MSSCSHWPLLGMSCATECYGDIWCRKKPQALGLLRFCLLFYTWTFFEKSKIQRTSWVVIQCFWFPFHRGECLGLVKAVSHSRGVFVCLECFQYGPQKRKGTIPYSSLCKASQIGNGSKGRLFLVFVFFPVWVCNGCYNKVPRKRWLKQQKCVFSQFWRLEA